ncbi:MAG: Acetoin catabolism protein X, possible NAD kinase [uncultured Paraburkholderia sp.]|nr:MAG: Acetoin catabolism protein X, possible NAD kinase [uncultured Paraburkholderia sp.]CAH2938799.1 MAG: Acetoin catabolism protein X, possible NAD kinase [uncultured Paraburkholderia sp.]
MVVRLLAGLGALGVERVLTLRDRTGVAALLLRALETYTAVGAQQRWPAVDFIEQPITDSAADTHAGVAAMLNAGVELIAVLGGDGTYRAVAAHCGRVPLLTLSTGTNNAFPDLREAAMAGLTGALAVSGTVPPEVAFTRNKRLVVCCADGPNRGREEIALVNVCVSRQRFVGARAISEPSDIDTLFLTFAPSDGIGLSSIGGAWVPVERTASHGLHMRFARPGESGVPLVAPIAPGRVERVLMRTCERFEVGN